MARVDFVNALLKARLAAYPKGQFVGQESFMEADEILELARAAGIGPQTRVLDLCCGVAGPGNFIALHLGSEHLGVDRESDAVELAQAEADRLGLRARYQVGQVPELGELGTFDVVMLLETILAFPDKRPLLEEIFARLGAGGTFLMTYEEGQPLSADERLEMPDSDTVWPIPRAEMDALVADVGFVIERCQDLTEPHSYIAARLEAAFQADGAAIALALGEPTFKEILRAHRVWTEWLTSRRIRKFSVSGKVL